MDGWRDGGKKEERRSEKGPPTYTHTQHTHTRTLHTLSPATGGFKKRGVGGGERDL